MSVSPVRFLVSRESSFFLEIPTIAEMSEVDEDTEVLADKGWVVPNSDSTRIFDTPELERQAVERDDEEDTDDALDSFAMPFIACRCRKDKDGNGVKEDESSSRNLWSERLLGAGSLLDAFARLGACFGGLWTAAFATDATATARFILSSYSFLPCRSWVTIGDAVFDFFPILADDLSSRLWILAFDKIFFANRTNSWCENPSGSAITISPCRNPMLW
jgi:hypothetical protein